MAISSYGVALPYGRDNIASFHFQELSVISDSLQMKKYDEPLIRLLLSRNQNIYNRRALEQTNATVSKRLIS